MNNQSAACSCNLDTLSQIDNCCEVRSTQGASTRLSRRQDCSSADAILPSRSGTELEIGTWYGLGLLALTPAMCTNRLTSCCSRAMLPHSLYCSQLSRRCFAIAHPPAASWLPKVAPIATCLSASEQEDVRPLCIWLA